MTREDWDIIMRLHVIDDPIYFINQPPSKSAIKNSFKDRIQETNYQKTDDESECERLYQVMNNANKNRSIQRLFTDGPYIKDSLNCSYLGYLNGIKTLIKEFNYVES